MARIVPRPNVLCLAAGFMILACFCPAYAVDTVEELAKAALFSFAVVSDHHGISPFTACRDGYGGIVCRMDRVDQWIKEANDRCIVGVGDHTYHYYRNDPFCPFMNTDSFWHARFYPAIGNHDNECYGGSETLWCGGAGIFDDVELSSRPWVTMRPNNCEYYAQIPVGDWTIHLIHVQYAFEKADADRGFREDSRQYLINTLNSISRGPKDIVIATAHVGTQADGNFVSVMTAAQQETVMRKCDYVFAGHTHRYQRFIHSNPTYGGATNGALCLNSGCVMGGSTSGNGYIQCFVFDNPPRVVSIYYDIDNFGTPQLRTGTSSTGAYYSYVKKLGQVSNSVSWMATADDWDAFPGVAASPDGAFKSGWNLVSVPLDPANPDAASVLSGLVGGGNVLSHNLVRYSPSAGYEIYPEDFSQIEAGRGYWLRLQSPGTVSYVGNSRPSTTYVPASGALALGWNLVAIPRTWPILLDRIQVRRGTGSPYSWSLAVQYGWVDPTLYYYEDGVYKTVRTSGGDDNTLRPWKSYWIWSKRWTDLSLVIPPGEEPTPVLKIADVQVSGVTATTAVVSWTSLINSTSRVDFGPTASYGDAVENPTLTRMHSMTLTGLPPGTTIHFKVTSTATGYAAGVSADATFTTASSAILPANAGFEAGDLRDWVPWSGGSSTDLMAVGSSSWGSITPRSGSKLAYTKTSTDSNGGLYARVSAVPGKTYEASVWSNMYAIKYPAPNPPPEDCRSRVGIDPTGGRDPRSAAIVWSEWDQRVYPPQREWRRFAAQAVAQAPWVTIFLEFYQHYEAGSTHMMVNDFDDAGLTQLP